MFKLNQGQLDAIRKALTWYYYETSKKPAFFLTGAAGTGKSSTASTLVSMLGLSSYQVVYACYTGKACAVLRQKGCQANTIHSMFYRILQLPEMTRPAFIKKKKMPNTIKLIVIDEVSMVNGKMMDDILSFGIPVLCLGDPGQLPPMFYKNPYLDNPDVFLEEVMRQAGDSGILILATMARKDIPIDYGVYKESRVIHMSEITNIEDYDVILTWTNSTRKELNALIRQKLGIESVYPVEGEKLVCLRNNYIYQLDLGDEFIVTPVNGLGMINLSNAQQEKDYLIMDYAPDYIKDQVFTTKVSKIPFESYNGMIDYEDQINNFPDDEVVLDFGYALTVSKSQGSSWPNVLVIDEYHGDRSAYKNWLYTAITRASKSVTIARTI